MGTEETGLNTEIKEKVVEIFSHFMERVAKLEELAAAGNRYLVSFRQALEFIRRPSIDKTSELLQKVITANETDRIQSYIKAGCSHATNRAENLNKCKGLFEVNASQIQLLNDMSKAKMIINELECLVEDVKLAIEAANETLEEGSPDLAATYSEEGMVSFVPEKPQVIDYAIIVAVVYSMVKQDYMMQEKIVSSLNLKTSSGEIESYCMMWSLRPFVNDEIMHQAWRLIP